MSFDDLAFARPADETPAVCFACERTWTLPAADRLCPSCAIPLRRISAAEAALVDAARQRAYARAEAAEAAASSGAANNQHAGAAAAAHEPPPPPQLGGLALFELLQTAQAVAQLGGGEGMGALLGMGMPFAAATAAGDGSGSRAASAASIAALQRIDLRDPAAQLPSTAQLVLTLLADSVLEVHECVAVPAKFSGALLPASGGAGAAADAGSNASAALVRADAAALPRMLLASPPTGKLWGNASAARGRVAFFERGEISFVTKALQAQAAGALACIVAQAPERAAEWPLEMVDGAGELASSSGGNLRIPVLMVSPSDAVHIRRLAASAAAPPPSSDGGGSRGGGSREGADDAAPRESARLHVHLSRALRGSAHECPVCCESFDIGAQLVVLPCQHVYHELCIVPWLQRTHTCPLCRFALPLDPAAAAAAAAEAAMRDALARQRREHAEREAAAAAWYS